MGSPGAYYKFLNWKEGMVYPPWSPVESLIKATDIKTIMKFVLYYFS